MGDHLPWLTRVARKFKRRVPPSVELSDLINDGYFGLLEAQRAFNPARGIPFTGFAYRRVIGAMRDGLRARYRPSVALKNEPESAERSRIPIDPLLNPLKRTHRLVLHLHYLEGMTLRSIGECFDVSEVRASQLHRAALKEARSKYEERTVPPSRRAHFSDPVFIKPKEKVRERRLADFPKL